jgi:hypothetical protein
MNAPAQPLYGDLDFRRRAQWQERRAVAFPLILLLAVALVTPAALDQRLLNDNLQVYWVWADQFTAELARGNLFPRWLPQSYGGLGAPIFYYYPPLAFYLAGAFGLAGASTYASLIAAFAAAFAASGIGCWYWLRRRTRHPLVGAALFMAMPYHVFDYSVRAALAESVGIALIPVLAIGLRRISENRGGVAISALAYAALIATHLPLALLVGLLFAAPYSLCHRHALRRFAIAGTAGVALAAICLVPALALDRFHDVGQLYRTASLQTRYYSIYAGHWADGTVLTMFMILGAIVLAAVWPALWSRDRWAIYAIAIAVAVSGAIPFLWSLPLLEKVQFPYRALPLAEFALATSLARLRYRSAGAIALGALPLALSLALLAGVESPMPNLDALRANHPDTYEYLPKGVIKPGQTQAHLRDVLADRLPPPKVRGKVVEPTFYFPAWSCGEPEPHTQLLMHPPGCKPRLIWTTPEWIGAAISLASLLLLLLLSVQKPTTILARRRSKLDCRPG